jgi:hypothetical protein
MSPAEEMRAAATKLRERVIAALGEIDANPYWGGDPDNFANGINNACGGAAGELAAMFSPDAAEALALVLDDTAKSYDDLSKDYGAEVAERIVWYVLVTARVVTGGES